MNAEQHNGEFVVADPRDGIDPAHCRGEPPAHLAQQMVAREMPQAIVDRAEAIEIDRQKRHAPPAALRLQHGAVQAIAHRRIAFVLR